MKRVLLIDDHPAVSVIVGCYLRGLGFSKDTLVHAADVEAGLEILQQADDFGAVLLDNAVPPYFEYRGSLGMIRDAGIMTPIVLFTGFPPKDLGMHELDSELHSVFEKDNLSPENLWETLQQLGLSQYAVKQAA